MAVGCYFARRVTNRTTRENKYMPEPLPEPAAYLALFCSSQSSWRGATVHHTYLNGSWLPIEVQPVLHSQRQGLLLLVLLAGVVLVASATCRKATIVRQTTATTGERMRPDAMCRTVESVHTGRTFVMGRYASPTLGWVVHYAAMSAV